MTVRDVAFYLRGRLNLGVTRLRNRRAAPLVSVPIETALAATGSPMALVPLLEGRTNPEREAAVARWLETRGIPFARHAFSRTEGRGENFVVEVGDGPRVLLLIAHHDAVPMSPGANDNAAAVGILLHLLEGMRALPPRGVRVRLLFTAAEEIGYLGARAYAGEQSLGDIAGVLSLELCGIGDSLAVWDATDETPFLATVRRALERIGLAADDGYHVVGRIPVFGSDHRAFAPALPAYGLTVVPRAQAEMLRSFIFRPVRSALAHLVRRPQPFDTYHTRADGGDTLDPAALGLASRALEAIIAELSDVRR